MLCINTLWKKAEYTCKCISTCISWTNPKPPSNESAYFSDLWWKIFQLIWSYSLMKSGWDYYCDIMAYSHRNLAPLNLFEVLILISCRGARRLCTQLWVHVRKGGMYTYVSVFSYYIYTQKYSLTLNFGFVLLLACSYILHRCDNFTLSCFICCERVKTQSKQQFHLENWKCLKLFPS